MVRYLRGRNPLINNLKGDICVGSDCEGGSPDVMGEQLEGKEGREGQTRAVFVTGSFATYVHFVCRCLYRNDWFLSWKSLFFYLCTGIVTFAPLGSQGIDARLNYIRQNTTAAAPPPCSPKGIYALAESVRQS